MPREFKVKYSEKKAESLSHWGIFLSSLIRVDKMSITYTDQYGDSHAIQDSDYPVYQYSPMPYAEFNKIIDGQKEWKLISWIRFA